MMSICPVIVGLEYVNIFFTDYGQPALSGYVANAGSKTIYRCRVKVIFYADENTPIASKLDFPLKRMRYVEIEPGDMAYFEVVADNVTPYKHIHHYEVEISADSWFFSTEIFPISAGWFT